MSEPVSAPTVADRLAAIDPTLACTLAEHAAEDAASTAVVLAYSTRHGDLPCLRDALPSLRSALLAQPDGTTAYGLEQLGPLTDGDRQVLSGWLASQSAAGGVLSPQAIEELAPTVVATGDQPNGLGAAAARRSRT